MLKIWKQSWRREGSFVSQDSDAGHDGGQDVQMSGNDGDELSKGSPASSPLVFEHHILGPVTSSTQSKSTKPARRVIQDLDVSSSTDVDRPQKRRKYEEQDVDLASVDPLANHLPEVIDVDGPEVSSEAPAQSYSGDNMQADENPLPYMIVEQAKRENTIALIDSNDLKKGIATHLLLWACETERERPHSGIVRRRRVAVVVVDDIGLVDAWATELSESRDLSIGVYTQLLHSSRVNQWSELLMKDVIVVAANLFLESLIRGALAMSQIHFLLFNDAQVIKDNPTHPVKQVMQDFYRVTDPMSRPRVLGMIIPDIDAKFYFDVGLLKLEKILDASVFGIAGDIRAKIMTSPDKATEFVVYYEPQLKMTETRLFSQLVAFDPQETIFRSQFRSARYALAELGACASDLIWRRALKDISSTVEPVYEEDEELEEGSPAYIAKAKLNVKDVIKNWSFAMPSLDPTSRGFNVTPKFAKLVQILKACESQSDSFRGIIFVQRRNIAVVLADILRTLDDHVGFLRPQVIAGHKPFSDDATLNDTLEGFRTGTFNLLISTKFGEDLEIAPATVVIRFDLFESQVSYAHCRARAHRHDCHLVHMAERGSDVHKRMLSQISKHDAKLERWMHRVATSPGSALPPSKLRETNNPYRSDSDDEDEDPASFIQDPTTSGRIYVRDATTVIYNFVSRFASGTDKTQKPLFEFEEFKGSLGERSTYICTVLLPGGAPITKVSGPPYPSMSEARRAACYQTCLELFQKGFLGYRFFPRPPLPTARRQRKSYVSSHMAEEISDKEDDEAFLPVKGRHGQSQSSGTRPYSRKMPDFWPNTLPIMNGRLHPTVVIPEVPAQQSGSDNEHIEEHYTPVLLLTRLPLPPIRTFKLFFNGAPGTVSFITAAAIEVDEDRLNDLHEYTLRMIRATMNKPFACPLENIPYFIAPLSAKWQPPEGEGSEWSFPNVSEHIPWDAVHLSAECGLVPLKSQDLDTMTEDTADAVIQDRWVEFTRRYYCVRMRPDLTPLSKPEDSLREKNYENLVEYCKARRKGFEGLQNYKQPLIEVSRVPTVINHLNPASKPFSDSKKKPAKYLIPELCYKFTIPASVFRTGLLLPSVLRRLDDILLVKELNAKFFDHLINEEHLHAAVSTPSAAVESDYERLELLGDAYLKYLASIYLFVTYPTQHEGALHISRQRIISNRSLLRNADRSGLPQFVQSKQFTTKNWAPPKFVIAKPMKAVQNDSTNNDTQTTGPAAEEGEIMEEGEVKESVQAAVTVKREASPIDLNNPTSNAVKVENKSVELPAPDGPPEPADGAAPSPPDAGQDKRPQQPQGKKNKQNDDESIQWLGDKCVADVSEAIIGAAYITGGREIALKITKALNIPVPHIDRWSDFGKKALAPPPEVTAKLRDGSVDAVEEIIGHKFFRPHLLAQALTHSSINGNEMTCYERLEFIGDAVLDFLVIRHIFDRDGMLSPGALTLLKGAMVNNAALAAVCVWAGLHEHLLFESYSLAHSIQAYADQLIAAERADLDLAAKEGRAPGQYWTEIEPPKALSDVVESILGALYVSDNFSPVGVEAFFDKVLKPFYDRHITLQTLSHHPTKTLFELFQSRGCQNFSIDRQIVEDSAGNPEFQCDVLVHDIVLARGNDVASNVAARRASFYALEAIEGDPDFLSRTCNCRELSKNRKAEKKALQKAVAVAEEEKIVESAGTVTH